jgi:hypothetical protein
MKIQTGEKTNTMTNKIFKSLAIFAIAIACVLPAGAQTAASTTTLSTAITSTGGSAIVVASTSTMLNPGQTGQVNTALWVDRELMTVISVVDSTHLTVRRGGGVTGAGGRPTLHASGATVYFFNTVTQGSVASPAMSFFHNGSVASEVAGYCISNQEKSLPIIYTFSGNMYNCTRTGASGTSGQYVIVQNGSMGNAGKEASAFCTGTVTTLQTEYLNFAACAGSTAEGGGYVVTNAGTVYNLYVSAGTAVTGGSGVDVLTVRKNGNDTTVTCTFATGGAATTCSDTVHGVAVVAGDVLTFKFVTASGDTAANVRASVGIY